jgi:hypothetical protein
MVIGVALAVPIQATNAEEEPAMKVLYFTKSAGFEHSVVKRDGENLSHSERILKDYLGRFGIEVVCSKDGGMIDAETLKGFDSVLCYTSGNLFEEGTDRHPPISPAGLEALFEWIESGGGFIGIHAATDSQRDEAPTEYTKMIGAAFVRHGKQEYANVRVVDPKFPGMAGLPVEFRMIEEWYLHNQINAAGNMRVLALLETGKMEQEMYNQNETVPLMWASDYGKGRVFYTALGHREEVWEMPLMQGLIRDAIAWTAGKVEADVSPNFEEFLK